MLACTACGRINFDGPTDGSTSDVVTDGIMVDIPANAMMTTFGERPTADVQGVTTDTFISNEAGEPTLNNGGTEELRSEQDVSERILLRFDLSTLPITATVVGASVSLQVLQTNASATWEIHPVLEAWTEGTGDSTPGAANFTQRTAGSTWTSVGCGEPFSAGPTFTTIGSIPMGPFTIGLDTAAVQNWVSNPAANFGMVFYNTFGESLRFASSEHLTQTFRPQLSVTFIP